MKVLLQVQRRLKTQLWWFVTLIVILTVMEVTSLSGPNICMVKQKYNITKRVKYRAPMSVRTYEWCFAVPPRCSKWTTEMRDVTRLETEERTAEMAVCCPGYKLKDVYCVPICPNGKTGHGCSEDCPPNKWGPNCVHECKKCDHGACDAATGQCLCLDGWQGESCETSMSTTEAVAMMEQSLTTVKTFASTKNTEQTLPTANKSRKTIATASSTMAYINTTSSPVITSEQTTNTAIFDKKVTQSTIPSISTMFTTKYIPVSSTEQTSTTRDTLSFSSNVTLYSYPTTLDTYKIITENDYKRQSLDKLNLSQNKTESSHRSTTYTPTETTTAMVTEETTLQKIFPETQAELTTSKPSTRPTFTSKSPQPTTVSTTLKETTVTKETQETRRTETTVKQTSTTKFRPKEIWIRPAQKGDSSFTEIKVKTSQEDSHTSKARDLSEVTTPKTIIVSIIPTSVSYVIFKKMALSTAPSMALSTFPQQHNHLTTKFNRKSTNRGYTKSMLLQTTALPQMVKSSSINFPSTSTFNPLLVTNVTKYKPYAGTTRNSPKTTISTIQTTNSMTSTLNVAYKRLNSSSLTQVPSFSTNVTSTTRKYYAPEIYTSKLLNTTTSSNSLTTEKATTKLLSIHKQSVTVMHKSTTEKLMETTYTEAPKVMKTLTPNEFYTKKINLTTTNYVTVINNPLKDEDNFHILTEPEHITAVMGDKETDRSTIDLISVISIAGGIMMAIITVAVLIVMLDRCKKPRYEEVRKYNDINMQVMIDNNDIPPPYVRSIFHTPLPDPPTSEKCHYQPISTLDRNLKQFMRPVVVQTISPLMLENFRGILECHYDHLPRRSEDMGTLPARCSVTPSINDTTELLPRRGHSITDSTIEALKCEAKLDVIDNTTSEPLYAEIPCWRPPSAHAIEVVNVNGEAVTEL